MDTRGQPVVNADVYLAPGDRSSGVPLENLDPNDLSWSRRTQAQTDDNGWFQLEPIEAGVLRLAVRARAFAPHDRTVPSRDALHGLGDIVLQDGVVLAGHVVDAAHRPVAGALIRRLETDARPAAILGSAVGDVVATTADDGSFRIDQLASGGWFLSIRAEGYPDKLQRGETSAPGQIVSGVEIVLEEAAEIRGRVLQAPPGALDELWVRAIPKNTSGGERLYAGEHVDEARFVALPRVARCAPDGSFSVHGLTRDLTYRLAARAGEHDFFGRMCTAWVEARAGEIGVELVYAPEAALRFQVVDAMTSRPVTEFEVRAGNPISLPLTADDGSIKHNFTAGRVRLAAGLDRRAGDTLEIAIEARGYATLRVAAPFPVAGQELDLGLLRLEPAPMITVRVLDDATGAPISGARVVLDEDPRARSPEDGSSGATDPRTPKPAGSLTHSAPSDREGCARLNSLPGKSAMLRVIHPDFAAFQSEIRLLPTLGDRAETVRMHRGGSVIVEVRDALGAPVRGVRIHHTGPDGEEPSQDARMIEMTLTDARGRLGFEHLAAGVHQFDVDLDRERAPAPGARPFVPLDPSAQTGTSGVGTQAAATVSEGSRQTVTLILPPSVRLRGRVTEGGQPLSGATLRLLSDRAEPSTQPRAGPDRSARTNGNGDFALDDVSPGPYRAVIVHPTRAMPFESDVRIDEEQNRFDVDLPLSSIEGRITAEDNAPLAGLRVRVERVAAPFLPSGSATEPASADARDRSSGSGPAEPLGTSRTFSGADGSYVLRGVQCDVDVIVKVEGRDFQPAESGVLRIASGQVKSGIDMKLLVGAVLEVSVAYADGRSGAACRVRAQLDGTGIPVVALTGPGGVARFSGLRPGRWHLHVEARAVGTERGAELAAPVPLDPGHVVDVKLWETNSIRLELH